MAISQITLKRIPKPAVKQLDMDIEWLFKTLGLQRGRDIEKTGLMIFKKLLEFITEQGSVSTEQLSKELNMLSGKINHHIRKLIEAGLVERRKKRIYLSGESLSVAIEEIIRDIELIISDLREIAKDIEEQLKVNP